MQFQAPRFDFVAEGARGLAAGLEGFAYAKEKERKEKSAADLYKLDDDKAQEAYSQIIEEIKVRWKNATGKDDDIAATKFATMYVMPKFKSETASQAATRWANSETKLLKALEDLKSEKASATATHVGKQISGGYGPEVYQAVMAGRMSPAEINRQYGTNLDQAEYERIAGLQVPQPLTGQYQSPQERMTAVKAASVADQPMSQGQALEETSIAQPMPYSRAIQTVQGAGLPEEQAKTLQPIISSAAARSTSETYKRLQKPTETQFLTEKLGKGEPIDEGAKAVAGSIRAETTAAAKEDYNKMRRTEQQVSLLKAYMQDWKNRRDFEYKWGKEAIAAVDDLNVLVQKKLDVENDINAAQNWTDMDKPAPDVNVLREKSRMYQNQIDDMISKIPDLESMAESVGRAPTRLTPPEIENPHERKTKKGKGLELQAREWLVSRGNAKPTPAQIQKVMVKMQDKMNER